jgi:hypothetical protein
MGKTEGAPLSCFDYVPENSDELSRITILGSDHFGFYEAELFRRQARDGMNTIEIRRYRDSNGGLRRIMKLEGRVFGEVLIRSEEWSETGEWQIITYFDDRGEWLWQKSIHLKTSRKRLSINRDSFLFFGIPQNIIASLEDDGFDPSGLLDIRWEGVREAILEILGAGKVVPVLPMETADSLGLNKLLKMEWRDRWGEPRMEPWCFLELRCTSTEKVSYLRVPPLLNDIMSAIAWTFGMGKRDYQLEIET